MRQGPSSNNRPVEELQPGPPLSQRTRGSFLGLFLDSKNLAPNEGIDHEDQSNDDSPKEQMLSISNVEVARILFDRWVAEMRLGRPELIVG